MSKTGSRYFHGYCIRPLRFAWICQSLVVIVCSILPPSTHQTRFCLPDSFVLLKSFPCLFKHVCKNGENLATCMSSCLSSICLELACLINNKVCSLSHSACPLLPKWLWWATCHKRTSAEIPVIGALWSGCYSKMAFSQLLPSWASFQASLCQLYSPLLHVPQYAHHYLYQMLLLHVVCTQSCRW